MGSLSLPASGLVYIDTQIVIYSVEKHPIYWPLLAHVWTDSKAGAVQLVTSELALLETLVGPFKSGDTRLAATYEQLLQSTEIRLEPITPQILKDAARLRAQTGLKAPDAIHAATAIALNCAAFLGNDYDLRKVTGLGALILDEALQP